MAPGPERAQSRRGWIWSSHEDGGLDISCNGYCTCASHYTVDLVWPHRSLVFFRKTTGSTEGTRRAVRIAATTSGLQTVVRNATVIKESYPN